MARSGIRDDTGPCEMATQAPSRPGITELRVIKCGRPGTFQPSMLRPFGTFVCDECQRATDEARAAVLQGLAE